MAIQVAKALGASPVMCTVGTAVKAKRCRELGADVAINYRDDDFVAAARAASADRGADVVLDIIGAKYLERNVEVLAPDGRLVVIGLQGGAKAELDLGVMLRKRAVVHATSLRARPLQQKGAICVDVVARLWPLVSSGRVQPVVHATYPMDQVADAHRAMAASEHVGKILLTRP
jgi:NADPH:quinone reductase-like Zn-dependent oxidoreductase